LSNGLSFQQQLYRALALILVICVEGTPYARAEQPKRPRYGEPEQLCVLENRDIKESSGLAVSQRRNNVFWTHNDSGDRPRIFAFDQQGRDWGEFRIAGAGSVDWEDMASFQLNGVPCLLLADVGDNPQKRDKSVLYVVEEPGDNTAIVRRLLTIEFTYEDGSQNCEAVAFDPISRHILLLSKKYLTSAVYELPVPRLSHGVHLTVKKQTARRIATLALPMTTAMDISSDGSRAVVLTYGHAYEYARQHREAWSIALRRSPREIKMPPRPQGETICYGSDGAALFLTSEMARTPFWRVPVALNSGSN
jgi:hypothetical protein